MKRIDWIVIGSWVSGLVATGLVYVAIIWLVLRVLTGHW